MDVICIYKPSVIYLTGDKERERHLLTICGIDIKLE